MDPWGNDVGWDPVWGQERDVTLFIKNFLGRVLLNENRFNRLNGATYSIERFCNRSLETTVFARIAFSGGSFLSSKKKKADATIVFSVTKSRVGFKTPIN